MNKSTYNQLVKDEIVSCKLQKKCCRDALLYGMLITGNRFDDSEIRFVSENNGIAELCLSLLSKSISGSNGIKEACTSGKHTEYKVSADPKCVISYFNRANNREEVISTFRINKEFLICDECACAFLKGVFLSCGNVQIPEKSYRIEFVFRYFNLSREVLYLLKTKGFSPKYTKRGSYYVVYLKESDAIVDLLVFLGAVQCSFKFTDAKIERDIRNNVNRIQNCDLANMERCVTTASKQISAINKLIETGKIDDLPKGYAETAEIRIKNPDSSFAELAQMHSPPVSKSCVNHRLKRMTEYFDENCEE